MELHISLSLENPTEGTYLWTGGHPDHNPELGMLPAKGAEQRLVLGEAPVKTLSSSPHGKEAGSSLILQ